MRYHFNDCRFDSADGCLTGASESLTLRPQAGRLLECFLNRPDEVLDRDTLCQAVWREGTVVDFESGLAALIRELRQALEQVGAGTELIETVPRRGYRFLGQPHKAEVPATPADGDGPVRKRLVGIGLLVVAVVIAGSMLVWLVRSPPPETVFAGPALAILPFDSYRDETDERRVEILLADSVLARLWDAELENLVLIGRATLRPYQERDDVAVAVARDLGVELIIEGSVQGEAGDWVINARLLRMPAGIVMWSESVEWADQPQLPVGESADYLVTSLKSAWPQLVGHAAP